MSIPLTLVGSLLSFLLSLFLSFHCFLISSIISFFTFTLLLTILSYALLHLLFKFLPTLNFLLRFYILPLLPPPSLPPFLFPSSSIFLSLFRIPSSSSLLLLPFFPISHPNFPRLALTSFLHLLPIPSLYSYLHADIQSTLPLFINSSNSCYSPFE